MQKQHVKINKQRSTRALPSRPQSERTGLRSLPSTPTISTLPRTTLSPPGGELGPLREILTMEGDVTPMDIYDIPDGCVFSKTASDKVPPAASDEPVEYATSSNMRQLANEHKFQSLPRLPRTPSGDGIHSIASDPSEELASLYSSVSEQSSLSSQIQPIESSGQDLYSVVDKSAKRNNPSDSPSVQPHDIYSVVNKSAKKEKPSDTQLSSFSEELPSITHKPVIKKKPVRSPQQQQPPLEELYKVVQKRNKPVVHDKPEYVFNTAADKKQQPPAAVEELYSVVNKPAVKQKPQKPSPEDIYSVVNKPSVKPKPVKYNSQHNINVTNSSTSSEPPMQLSRLRVKSADVYAEVTPKQIENGDIYSVVNKPRPPPVAKKPDRQQKRIVSDSSVTMETGMQEDNQSHDSGVEDEPTIPGRFYDDDELELDDEPPELPPRLYSLSDFDTEDELCFDDIMEDFNDERTFDNPLYQTCKPLGQLGEEDRHEESNPLYQTLASIRKEMDGSKSKTGTLKVSKYCCHGYYIYSTYNPQRVIR